MEEKKALGKHNVHATSNKQDYETPDETYNELHSELKFTIDVCASKENAKHERFFTEEDNGLKQSWHGERCFCNPPYKYTSKWVAKAYEETQRPDGAQLVALLIPARPDTTYWHKWILQTPVGNSYANTRNIPKNIEVRFIKGRLRFKGAQNSAPFPSCVIIFYNSSYGMLAD